MADCWFISRVLLKGKRETERAKVRIDPPWRGTVLVIRRALGFRAHCYTHRDNGGSMGYELSSVRIADNPCPGFRRTGESSVAEVLFALVHVHIYVY
jgi:hypothetical protein